MLTNKSKIAYATGAVPNGIKVDMFTFFLLFYYGNVVGLEPGLAGLAIAIALFFDAFTDPIIGSISDRTNSSIGRRHPYLFASVVPIVVGYIFLFMPRADWELTQASLFIWMLSFCIITRFGMTLFDVPHRALGGEITKDYDERTSLFVWMLSFCIITRFGMTLFDVPHRALGGEITKDYDERTALFSIRELFGLSLIHI